jgi:hypothetical protein
MRDRLNLIEQTFYFPPLLNECSFECTWVNKGGQPKNIIPLDTSQRSIMSMFNNTSVASPSVETTMAASVSTDTICI